MRRWWRRKPARLFHCYCGCWRNFYANTMWDGYHGPDFGNPVEKPS